MSYRANPITTATAAIATRSPHESADDPVFTEMKRRGWGLMQVFLERSLRSKSAAAKGQLSFPTKSRECAAIVRPGLSRSIPLQHLPQRLAVEQRDGTLDHADDP